MKILTPSLSKVTIQDKHNKQKTKGTPSLPLHCFSGRFYINSSSSSSPGPTVCTLVHPMSTPVGLTDTLIICLAAALASIDLMKGTIEQNNKRNTTTTMPIMMPTLVNHCPQDPKSKFKPIPSMHVYSSILGHFLSQVFQFLHCFGERSSWGCTV